MSPQATAMPRLPRPAGLPTSCRRTMSARCSSAGASERGPTVLPVVFQEADAEALPFVDKSFDVVPSTFGVMFTPNQQQGANEMIRVCRSGGKIGLANWTPEGFVGTLFKIIGKYVPPAPGVKSPALGGTEAHLDALFGGEGTIGVRSSTFVFRYRSPKHWLETF